MALDGMRKRERERGEREEKFQFHRLMNEGVLIISNDLENRSRNRAGTHSVNPPPLVGSAVSGH